MIQDELRLMEMADECYYCPKETDKKVKIANIRIKIKDKKTGRIFHIWWPQISGLLDLLYSRPENVSRATCG